MQIPKHSGVVGVGSGLYELLGKKNKVQYIKK